MSNLASTVLFDVVRGWPHGSAIDESFGVATGVTVYEGELVMLDSDGNVDRISSVVAEGGTDVDKYYLVIQGNDQTDAQFVEKVTCLRGDMTIETEKFIADTYTPGDRLVASVVAGKEGWLSKPTGTEQVVGVVEAYDATSGKLTAALSI